MSDIQIDCKTIPNRSEIKAYCKDRLIQERMSEELSKMTSKLLYDCSVWIEGYSQGVVSESHSFKHPFSEEEVKNFYLERIFEYIKKRLLE